MNLVLQTHIKQSSIAPKAPTRWTVGLWLRKQAAETDRNNAVEMLSPGTHISVQMQLDRFQQLSSSPSHVWFSPSTPKATRIQAFHVYHIAYGI
jgi:hypothetical protein